MNPIAIVMSALALAACGQASQPAPGAEQGGVRADGPQLAGNWAAGADLCPTPWVVSETGLTTPGGVSCTFSDIEPMPNAYVIQASCTENGGAPAPYEMIAVFEGADQMDIQGGPMGGPPLGRCP
ncbi:MAG: hypothetical protein GC206_11945 [Alphaproteobacteria bacterium]|nr:hypothetical protein [Alphaproteobacteria bacterium]